MKQFQNMVKKERSERWEMAKKEVRNSNSKQLFNSIQRDADENRGWRYVKWEKGAQLKKKIIIKKSFFLCSDIIDILQ